jgi:peroxiredoxin
MSLREKLDAFKADHRAGKPPYNAPPEIHPIMDRATKELIDTGRARSALKAGDRAPVFTLRDQNDNAVSSKDLLAKGSLVVCFYRGAWCPYCNLQLQALQEALPKFQELGASLVAISPQNQVNSSKSARQNSVTFPILSDMNNDVATQFGVTFALPDYLVELYKKLSYDLPAYNSDEGWTLPMPASYVISTAGKIIYAEVNPDFTHRPEPEDVLPVLEAQLVKR